VHVSIFFSLLCYLGGSGGVEDKQFLEAGDFGNVMTIKIEHPKNQSAYFLGEDDVTSKVFTVLLRVKVKSSSVVGCPRCNFRLHATLQDGENSRIDGLPIAQTLVCGNEAKIFMAVEAGWTWLWSLAQERRVSNRENDLNKTTAHGPRIHESESLELSDFLLHVDGDCLDGADREFKASSHDILIGIAVTPHVIEEHEQVILPRQFDELFLQICIYVYLCA
jgi:hypothetical protein